MTTVFLYYLSHPRSRGVIFIIDDRAILEKIPDKQKKLQKNVPVS